MISIDPLALIATVIGILVAIGIALWQRSQKMLSYSIVMVAPLIELDRNLKGTLKILYEDKPVTDVKQTLIQIQNTGNVPIEPSDYHSPIRIKFSKGHWTSLDFIILKAETIRASPNDLDIQLSTDVQDIVIQPALLNAGDNFFVQVLFSGYTEKIIVSGRVSGVKEILGEPWDNTTDKIMREMHSASNALIVWSAVSVILVFLLAIINQSSLVWYWFILSFTVLLASLILIGIRSLIRSLKRRNQKRELLR